MAMSGRFSIDALRYVPAVMDEASFSGAARIHQVSQPTLSTAVARLEEQLGHRLFDRSPTGVTPTEFAEEVRPLIEAVLNNVDGLVAASRRWGRSHQATIRLGVSPLIDATLVAGVHHELHARLPERPDVVLSEGNLDHLVAGLGTGGFDVVLVPSVRQLPGFHHRIVGSEPLVVVEQDPGQTGPVALSDLADRPLILVPETCGLTRFTRDLFAEHGLPLKRYPGEAASYRVLEDWADLGLGISVLPRSKLRAADSPHRVLQDGQSEVEIFYEMVWNPSSPISEVLRQIAWSALHRDGAG
jgi:DNA-binding transcriptional LysR family regulator